MRSFDSDFVSHRVIDILNPLTNTVVVLCLECLKVWPEGGLCGLCHRKISGR